MINRVTRRYPTGGTEISTLTHPKIHTTLHFDDVVHHPPTDSLSLLLCLSVSVSVYIYICLSLVSVSTSLISVVDGVRGTYSFGSFRRSY